MNKHHSVWPYVYGFGLSLTLTGSAFLMVQNHSLSRRGIILTLAGLVVAQLLVQLLLFLNLGGEGKPRWNLQAALFALMIVVIVAGGSLWIMHNLNYHMQTPAEMNQYLQHEGDL